MEISTGKTNVVGWNAGCAETCLSGAGSAGRKPTTEMQQGAVLRLQLVRSQLRLPTGLILSCTILLALGALPGPLWAATCNTVVHAVNQSLTPKIDEPELVAVLQHLNASHNTTLPPKFVTKKQARKLGWKPGKNLWAVKKLKGKSIGGDVFTNREGQLPNGGRTWHEADLAYKGGHRGAKRLVYSTDGRRQVTVDHYRTFTEVPTCQ